MTLSDDLKRYAVMTMLVGGVILTLSGLCTGLFISFGEDDYVPNALGVLGIGMIGIIPGAILFFSARRILKKGPGILSGILVLLVAVPILIMSVISLVNTIIDKAVPNTTPIMLLLLCIVLALAVTVFGVKTVRSAGKNPPTGDPF